MGARAQAPTQAPTQAPAQVPLQAPLQAPIEAPPSGYGSPPPRRRGYVRTASGYLYNSLPSLRGTPNSTPNSVPSLSGSASLRSTRSPLRQG